MKSIDATHLLNIGIALSGDNDSDHLLQTILDILMDLTECDGGTLYTLENNALTFYLMVTKSQNVYKGGHGETITLPPVPLRPENVCARSVLDKRLINIPDVYNTDLFDFSGPRHYDAITGYHTQSQLVVPMMDDKHEIIGVLQLINAMDNGKVTAFPPECEQVLLSLASQAATRLTNLKYSREITELLESFVRVMSVAIDARTPYNANHTRNMVHYGENFLKWLQDTGHPYQMSFEEEREFLMSVWLHDVGKLTIPLEVMDKTTRLGNGLREIEHRFETLQLKEELALARGEISPEEYNANSTSLAGALDIIRDADTAGFLTDEKLAEIEAISQRTYQKDGSPHPWITSEELHCLSVRKGTLTAEERMIMENHVVMTEKMLNEMHFCSGYKRVPLWAASHHEYLNGKGYPNHLKGKEIPWQVRLLTILDIFDALTARDRPYKKAMPAEKAFSILRAMVEDGQLDQELVELFIQSGAGTLGSDGEVI